MFKRFLYFLLICFPFSLFGQQNLVPNPSFEVYITCPNNIGQIEYSTLWFQPTAGTPDYYNNCTTYPLGVPINYAGYQNAHSGNAYAGFAAFLLAYDTTFPFPNYREYVEIKLDSQLQAGEKYFVSFYLSLSDSVNYATDAIGAFFSLDTVKNDTGCFLPLSPQIENMPGNYIVNKSGWIKISGNFTAQGGEHFLTIGNFKDYVNTNHIAVSGGSADVNQADWSGGYYYLDDICVSRDSIYAETWTGIERSIIDIQTKIYPNPVNDYLTIENHNKPGRYIIMNSLGQQVDHGQLTNNIQKIDLREIPSGVYFLSLDDTYYYKILISH